MINLQLPLKYIRLTQEFGQYWLDFYKKMGLKGHNGLDFEAKDGCPVYAAHSGIITWAGVDGDGGISVNIIASKEGKSFYTLYYHLKKAEVEVGNNVCAGQKIGEADNTGKYTTGEHLHFGLKETLNGGTINLDNGYLGAIDPTPYFVVNYQGVQFKNKDCFKSNAYHRYFRRNRNIKIEIRILGELVRYLKKLPTVEQINACVYGAWDRETIKNPAMYQLWGFITKGDYLNKILPFK